MSNESDNPTPGTPAPGDPAPGSPGRLATDPDAAVASRELVLVKNGQRYVFRCAPGEEGPLLKRLGDLVRDPSVDLTWFDAAVLSHQIGVRLGSQLQRTQTPRV